MEANVYFGYKCPKCGSTVGVGTTVGVSENLPCPTCATPMVPDPKGQASAANVYCPRCKIAVGLANSDRCPDCGGEWEALPSQ